MKLGEYSIKDFDPHTASEDLLNDTIIFCNKCLIELGSEENVLSTEETKKQWKERGPEKKHIIKIIMSNKEKKEKVVGYGQIIIETPESSTFEDNKHLGHLFIGIQKEYRRKGLGTKLVRILMGEINKIGYVETLATSASNDSAHKFIAKLGGIKSFTSESTKLPLNDVNWRLMEEWRLKGQKLAKEEDVKLITHENGVLDMDIHEFIDLYNVILSQEPSGDMNVKRIVEVEKWKEEERKIKEKGDKRIYKITKEKDGTISGFTGIYFNPKTSNFVRQLMTGVKEEFRGRGLGKWLKVDMLYYIKGNFPSVRYIESGTEVTNAPMQTINKKMGFKVHSTITWYNLNIDEVDKIL